MTPGSWETVALGDVCTLENGDRGKNYPGRKAFTLTGIPFINAGHLSSSGIDHERMNYISRDSYDRLGNGKIRQGDVLFCLRGSLGKFAIVEDIQEGAIASSLVILRPNNELDVRFLTLYLESELCQKMIDRYANGAAQPNLSGASLKKFEIPLPPLSEQRRIVSVLDAAFAGLATATAHTQKNLQNARELFETHLDSVFNSEAQEWDTKTVCEIADHCLGKMLDKQKNKGKARPYLRNLNVRWFEFELDDLLEMKIEDRELEKYSVQKGDLMICEGGYPGRAAIWDSDETIFFQKAIHRVRCKDPVFNQWLLYYLFYLDSGDKLKDHFTGAGIQHFTGRALAKLPVPLPTPEDAAEYIRRFDALNDSVERASEVMHKKLATLSELKQSILHRAFRGELSGGGSGGEVAEQLSEANA